jgi:hypothetical protein
LVITAFSTIFIDTSSIHILCGDNFADWKESIHFALGCVDLDLALYVDEPPTLAESSNAS